MARLFGIFNGQMDETIVIFNHIQLFTHTERIIIVFGNFYFGLNRKNEKPIYFKLDLFLNWMRQKNFSRRHECDFGQKNLQYQILPIQTN